MEYNSNFKYDLKIGNEKETELGKIFESQTIEVKYDKLACKTGNIYVEYKSRGKWSGISTSQSSYYCFMLSGAFEGYNILIKTAKLKEKVKHYYNLGKIKKGGDSNTSAGVLIPLNEFFQSTTKKLKKLNR